jgi:hypothetical protein
MSRPQPLLVIVSTKQCVNSALTVGCCTALLKKGVCSVIVGQVFIVTTGEKLGYVRWSKPVGWTGVYKLNEVTANDWQ